MTSTKNFKKALTGVELSSSQLAMVRVHYGAPDRRITMSKLAEAVGYKNYRAANLQYGKLGKQIAQFLSEEPDYRNADGSPVWLFMLAEGWKSASSGEWEWQMWPELAQALEELNLVG
jgi:hypothetical protein